MDADMLDENRIRLMTKLAICEKKGIERIYRSVDILKRIMRA